MLESEKKETEVIEDQDTAIETSETTGIEKNIEDDIEDSIDEDVSEADFGEDATDKTEGSPKKNTRRVNKLKKRLKQAEEELALLKRTATLDSSVTSTPNVEDKIPQVYKEYEILERRYMTKNPEFVSSTVPFLGSKFSPKVLATLVSKANFEPSDFHRLVQDFKNKITEISLDDDEQEQILQLYRLSKQPSAKKIDKFVEPTKSLRGKITQPIESNDRYMTHKEIINKYHSFNK